MTVGDVVRLIEANPPAGSQVTVAITLDRAQCFADAGGGGQLTIRKSAAAPRPPTWESSKPTGVPAQSWAAIWIRS